MRTFGRFFEMKRRGETIAVLTAYDAPTAQAEEDAGIDLILVGDSVGTNVLGYASEREVTLDDIAHHVRAVGRGAPDTPILADLPYATYDTPEQAVASARRLVEAGADMVKLEGCFPEIVRALVDEFDPSRTPQERRDDDARILMALSAGWQTAEASPVRPSVSDEFDHVGFYAARPIYRGLPALYESSQQAIDATPGQRVPPPRLPRPPSLARAPPDPRSTHPVVQRISDEYRHGKSVWPQKVR